MRFPMRCDQYELRPEPAAPGKWRGGIGIIRRNRFLVDGIYSCEGDRQYRPAARRLRRLGRPRGLLPQEPRHGPGGVPARQGDGHPVRAPASSSSSASRTRPATAIRSSATPSRSVRTSSTTSRRSSSPATPTASSSPTSGRSRSTSRRRGRCARSSRAKPSYTSLTDFHREPACLAPPAHVARRQRGVRDLMSVGPRQLPTRGTRRCCARSSGRRRRAGPPCAQGVRAGRRPAPRADHDGEARARRAAPERGAARAGVRRQPGHRARGAAGARRAESAPDREGRGGRQLRHAAVRRPHLRVPPVEHQPAHGRRAPDARGADRGAGAARGAGGAARGERRRDEDVERLLAAIPGETMRLDRGAVRLQQGLPLGR